MCAESLTAKELTDDYDYLCLLMTLHALEKVLDISCTIKTVWRTKSSEIIPHGRLSSFH